MKDENKEIAKKLVKAGVVLMPEMVYCNNGVLMTEKEAFSPNFKKSSKGCWHEKDRKCDCKCHKVNEVSQ